jgi:hypothetical protein
MIDRAPLAEATANTSHNDHEPLAVSFVSVVLPCLDEADAVAGVVAEARLGLMLAGVDGEIVVVDNGSSDDSAVIAERAGARVIHEARRGYGAAIAAGIRAARGDTIVVADADGSYDLTRLDQVLAPLAAGADLVVGSRFGPALVPRAMPPLHRYVGAPALTLLLRLLTGSDVSDSQSGFRAFRRSRIAELGLRSPGMEFASEMLLRAERSGWAVVEAPTGYRPRLGASKLEPWADGWRHLKLLLLLSPQASLLLPSVVAIALGCVLCALSFVAPHGVWLGPLRWLPVFLGPMLLILGGQAGLLGLLAAHRSPLAPPGLRRRLAWLGRPGGVRRLLAGCAAVAGIGAALDLLLFALWIDGRSGPQLLGLAGVAQAAIVVGLGGVATLLAVEFARDSLLDRIDPENQGFAVVEDDRHRRRRLGQPALPADPFPLADHEQIDAGAPG